MTPDQRRALRAHILAAGIAGDTATTRANTVSNAEKLAEGDPDKHLGIGARGRDTAGVMRAVADLCGCSDDVTERDGPGVIDPERTLDALAALAMRLKTAVVERERILIATGHPTGLLAMYQAIARALTGAGVDVLTPIDNLELDPPRKLRRRRMIRYLDGVGVLNTGADLLHTHESWPMDRMLDALEPPDLVLADHGFAGAAIARDLEVVCFTDVNDPAIAVAKADGVVDVVVPLDDNLPPAAYDPLRDHILRHLNGSSGT